MKPLKLSTKLNPLGEDMKQSNAFENLKKHDHSTSFGGLGTWLDQNSKQPRPMKNIYKVAASLIITALVLVACTVPLEQEEEIGYMIKGLASPDAISLKSKLGEIPGLDPSQVSVHQVLHEEIGKEKVQTLTEVVMILPEADYGSALEKKALLSGVFDFHSLEILPIEDIVERTFFETALHSFDIKLRPDISNTEIAERIDEFLHENSSIEGKSNVFTDENGVRYVEIVLEDALDGAKELGIKFNGDANAKIQLRRGIETLHQDLSQKNTFEILDSANMKEVEIQELRERKENLEKQKNN